MEYGAYSHKGRVRKCNEDYYYIPERSLTGLDFMIVADGMGGHNAGDLASRMAVEYIRGFLYDNCSRLQTVDELKDAMHQSIQEANRQVFALSKTQERLSGMGTTLTMAFFLDQAAHIAHVGDSRCYHIHDGLVRQITRDHSLVQELLDNGSITADEMETHPQKNVITRALGTEDFLKIDYVETPLSEGDIILLCSDGLIHYINLEGYVQELPAGLPLEKFAEILGNEALTAGGADNITIVAARYTSNREKR